MTEKKSLNLEAFLYILALCLALAFRLIGLGFVPFNESEAAWAWQAYQVSQSDAVVIGSQPAYVLLTSLVFFLFSSSEALARMLPALMGALVVVLPYALRDQIGRKAALVAAFGLALDPIMVAVSRQVGSPMLAVGFAALAVLAWRLRKPGFAGVFAGLLILSGLPIVPAAIAVGVTVLILKFSGYQPGFGEDEPFERKPFLVAVGLTLFVVGTLWMRYPQGLSAVLQAVPDYLAGWGGASAGENGIPLLQVLAALPIYQPIAFILALIALLQNKTWEAAGTRFAAMLTVVLSALVIVYPSRQTADLAWVLPLLWMLAGTVLAPNLQKVERGQRTVVWGLAITMIVMLAFWWSNIVQNTRTYYVNIPEGFRLVDFGTLDPGTQDYLARMVVVVVIPFVLAILTALIITNWSKQAALQGSLWGLGVFAVFYVIMVLFGINDARAQQAAELWSGAMAPGYADDLREALAELSEPNTGNRYDLEVVYQLDLALLHWELRDMPNARYASILNPGEDPAVIINDLSSLDELSGAGEYHGEKIALQLTRSWGGQALPTDFDRWLIYREAPIEKDWVVLWARTDIFIGYEEEDTGVEVDLTEPVEQP